MRGGIDRHDPGTIAGGCAGWRDKRPDCWVAVNVSPLLLGDPGMADRIEQKLQEHGVPPGALVLEITETNGIPDTPCAMAILTRLRIRGVNLAVDDFGTGHSSLLSLIRDAIQRNENRPGIRGRSDFQPRRP